MGSVGVRQARRLDNARRVVATELPGGAESEVGLQEPVQGQPGRRLEREHGREVDRPPAHSRIFLTRERRGREARVGGRAALRL
jgi:hypothetical protein